jgi:transposase
VPDEPLLLELPEQPPADSQTATESGAVAKKYIAIDRQQMTIRPVDVENLIGADHKARGIWELVGKLDLSGWEQRTRSSEGKAGRCAWPPQLLVSVWVYGYSEGITSARELARMMDYEPGLSWMAGLQVINHHTLSDFRVNSKKELDELFTQVLTVLDEGGVISLDRVMHDGTRIRARAGSSSFRREKTVKEKLAQVKELVEQDPQADGSKRRQQAQERAQRERTERVEEALRQLEQIQNKCRNEQERERARVSVSEPEARIMKHGDKAFAPSYNVQVSTEARSGVIVGVDLTQQADDSAALDAAMEEVKKNLGREPKQVVADGGYTNQSTVEKMEARGIDFIGSLRDPRERSEAAMKSVGIDPNYAPHFFIFHPEMNTLTCMAGKQLKYVRQSRKGDRRYRQYQADGADCSCCEHQPRCCPKSPSEGRTVSRLEQESEVMTRFRRKMASEEAQTIYKQRGAVAEFPFAVLKERFGLRKFRVFGIAKARMEATWACLAHNLMIWNRIVRATPATQAA